MATPAELRAIEERFLEEVVNRGDMSVFDELMSPEWHAEGGRDEEPWDRENLRRLLIAWRTGFPDLRATMTHLICDGDLCASRMVVEGTHTQGYLDLEASGTRVSGSIIFFDRIVDGRFVESWIESGSKGFYEQISGRPAPADAVAAAKT